MHKIKDISYDDWIYYHNLQDLDPFDTFIVCFYFVVQTVLTVGYGDLHSIKMNERIFSTFLMLTGVFIYSLVIGGVTSYFAKENLKESFFQGKAEILLNIQKDYKLDSKKFK